MCGKKGWRVLISIIATFLTAYVLIYAVKLGTSIWPYALLMTILVNFAVFFCPIFNPCVCKPKAPARKKRR